MMATGIRHKIVKKNKRCGVQECTTSTVTHKERCVKLTTNSVDEGASEHQQEAEAHRGLRKGGTVRHPN